MRKKLLFIFFFASLSVLLFSNITNAQESRGTIGIGISGGAMNYAGELDDDFTLVFTRPAFGMHALFVVFPRVHFRLTLLHGSIAANDAQANFTSNADRNLRFYSDVNEAGFHILYSLQSRKKGFTKRNFAVPYVFAGISYFQFAPKRNINGTEYDLQSIGTEGQYLPGDYPEPYKLQQFSVPFGFGFKIKISSNFDAGAEIGFRKTFTDYLDDVSTNYPDKTALYNAQGSLALYLSDSSTEPHDSGSRRGNPNNSDWYVYTNIHLTYYFTTSLFKQYKLKSQFKGNTCKGLFSGK
ncbi:MAG TPA: DUF6089 family protein [Bacteroidia bacterium]|jgi:hypothetical protein|nr:DUF6089 family protein [Bacteroidia bacterium]